MNEIKPCDIWGQPLHVDDMIVYAVKHSTWVDQHIAAVREIGTANGTYGSRSWSIKVEVFDPVYDVSYGGTWPGTKTPRKVVAYRRRTTTLSRVDAVLLLGYREKGLMDWFKLNSIEEKVS